jgi:glucose 1-dehydrogenase
VELARRGHDVVIGDLLPMEQASSVTGRIAETGRRVVYLQRDLTAAGVNQELVDAAVREFGGVDVCVCNAARGLRGPSVETDEAQARSLFDLVFWAGFTLANAAARQMIAQGAGGAIVFTSSVHSYRPFKNASVYNAAKAAVNHFARSLANELVPHKIRVNWIEPGWIDTEGERIHFGDAVIAEEGPKLPWGRLGRPEEMAKVIAFLASDDASYVTGVGVRADGGITLER